MQNHAPIYGVEYQTHGNTPLQPLLNHNVPCAVCHVSTRAAVLMIPAWRRCPTQWTLEYTGYLMTENHTHGKGTYECVDKDAASVPGSPPYDPQKELTLCALSEHYTMPPLLVYHDLPALPL